MLPLQHQPSPNLRTLPAFGLRRGVKAQASLVDRALRIEEMPGLKVEGRIVVPIQRGPERSPQRDGVVVNRLGGCSFPVLALNAQCRDDFGRLGALLHIRDHNRVGKKRASRGRDPQGEQRQDLAA